ncbi:MAG: DUF2585 family protein [Pyrinomonadaceae bacterium]|nr:DUF2585 family protein [Pyrinomonadaceae bacterium]
MTENNLIQRKTVIAFVAIIAVSAIILSLQGRVWWCQAGDLVPWSWDIWTTHNSQHLIDPYAFTHVLHGVLEFWLLGLIFGRVPVAWRFVMAVMIEATWEIAENSSYIIERYRTVTLSLDYFGDSIINSLADIVCCAAGFGLAKRLGFLRSLIFFIATEVILILWIRDSLVINIIMLIYPIEGLKAWQMSGR